MDGRECIFHAKLWHLHWKLHDLNKKIQLRHLKNLAMSLFSMNFKELKACGKKMWIVSCIIDNSQIRNNNIWL